MKRRINSAKIFKSAFVFILLICLVSASVPITFAATPTAQSVEIQDVECIYHADGYWDEDFDEDTWEATPEYFRYIFDPSFTVTLTDGTVLKSDDYGCVTYENEDYYLDYETGQSYKNQWDLGTYTVTAEIMGATSTFNVNIVESPVSKLEIENVELFEHSGGCWDADYNEETDDFDLEYYVYNIDPAFTVTLKDGTVLESEYEYYYGGNCVEYNGNVYFLDYEDYQSYDNQWGVGARTVTAEILGFTSLFSVSILESPVSKVEAADVELIENADGHWESEYNWETDDYDLSYFHYDIEPVFTVTMKDGTILESDYGWVTYKGEDYYLDCFTDQSYDNQWSAGTYTVNASIMGCETTFEVNIVPTIVESVKIEDVECIRNTSGYWDHDYNPDTDSYENEYYYYLPTVENFTVTLKDGTVLNGDYESVEYNGNYYELSYETDQSYDNQWGVGTHTVTASIMGFTTTFNVIVTESPVKSIEIPDVNYIENTNGYLCEDYNPETDDWDLEYFRYFIDCPTFTVTLNDGTVLEGEYGEILYNDESYYAYYDTDQSYKNQWGVGTHTVTADILGYETTFNINIEPCPVQSVSVPDLTLIENTNGYMDGDYNPETDDWGEEYFRYYLGSQNYSYIVTLNDGTVLESEEGFVEYKGISYDIYCDSDQTYENQWGVGTHKATAEVMGYETSFNVIIEPSPVKSVEIQKLNYMQYTNGCWDEGYNPDSDDWDGEYYYYFVDPSFTVTLNDGTVLRSEDGCVNYKGVDYELDFDTNQDYETQWGVGTHTVEAEIMGAQTSFDVTISNDVSGYKLGDVNLDGNVNVKDATYIQRMVVEEAGLTVTDVQKELADVNGDGTISVKDATQIQIIVVNT